jgi:hypothetical protein
MKLWHWALVGLALYEAAVGVSEILSVSSPSANPLASLSSLPSVGSLIQSTAQTTNTVAGVTDLATAAAIFIIPLHHHLKA